MADDEIKQSNDTIASQDTYPVRLTLGGKELKNIGVIKDQYQICNTVDYLYTNAPSLSNNGNCQFEIDTDNMRVKIGNARIKRKTGQWAGQTKNYTIWMNAVAFQDNGTQTGSTQSGIIIDSSGSNTGGGSSNYVEIQVSAGDGINIVKTSGTNVRDYRVSVDTDVIATKQDLRNLSINGGGGSSGGNNQGTTQPGSIDAWQRYQFRQYSNIFDIIYSTDNIKNLDVISQINSGQTSFVAFSYKHTNDNDFTQLNCVRIKTPHTSLENDVYCVIRKCPELVESGTSDYTPPTNLNEYIQGSQIISISSKPAIIVDGYYQWYFSKQFDILSVDTQNKNVYLVTFYSKKDASLTTDGLIAVTGYASSQSNVKSDLQRLWNINLNTQLKSVYASFCKKEHIGVKLR